MLCINEKLTEKHKEDDRTVFLVSSDPSKGDRVADYITEKPWKWETGECVMVYDAIEVFFDLDAAKRYHEWISYLPYPLYILEATALAEELRTACEFEFGGYTCTQAGYVRVTVTKNLGEGN